MNEAPLDVPPLDLTKVNENSGTPAPFGLKKDGTPAKKRGRKPGQSPARRSDIDTDDLDPDAKSFVEGLNEEITSVDQLADVLAAMFTIPAVLVDESFDLTNSDGQPNQRCRIAAKRLYPLCKKYGTGSLAKWMPEILAVWGIVELAKPSVGPVLEIVAGVRQPLIMRPPTLPASANPESPPTQV